MAETMAVPGWDAWSRAWEMRLVDRLPVSPVAVGLATATGLIALHTIVLLALGEPVTEPGGPAGLAEPVLGFGMAALVTGYALAAGYAFKVGNARALAELQSHLHGAVSPPGMTLAESRIYGAIGAVAGLAFIITVDEAARQLFASGELTADGLISLLLVPLPFWLFARAGYFTVGSVSSVSSLAERNLSLDLLDPSPLVPVGRMALRGALLWIGAAALTSLSIVLTGGSAAELTAVLFLLGMAAASFLLPVRGVHRLLRETKAAELRRARAEIRRDREAVASLDEGSQAAAARLPGLIAWETRIEGVREWPFDTPTLTRFALYLLIPLGSWLGGALVERSIDAFLD